MVHLVIACRRASLRRRLVGSKGPHIVSLFRLPKTDVLGGDADDAALGVDDTGSGTASANVDSYVVIHVGIEIIVRVN